VAVSFRFGTNGGNRSYDVRVRRGTGGRILRGSTLPGQSPAWDPDAPGPSACWALRARRYRIPCRRRLDAGFTSPKWKHRK